MKESILYKITRPIITFLFKVIYRPTIINKDNINNNGRLVLVGNHTSNLDCLLLMSCTKRVIHFLAKDELSKGPFSFIFKKFGLIFVNRREKDKKSLTTAINYLNEDRVVLVFPEGTINRTNNVILPFKYGAVKMSSVTDSYITPFVITGKYKILRKSITITFLKPYKITSDLELENKKLENIISNTLIKRR